MANQAIRGFYQITDQIKNALLTDPNVQTVTTGDLSEIDLSKQTIFPLSHILVNNVVVQENILSFNISVVAMDLVDINKESSSDIFFGNNNEHDVLNTQLAVLNKLCQKLRFGNLYTTKYQLEGDPVCEPFRDRFEHEMAGWTCTMDIHIDNDISLC